MTRYIAALLLSLIMASSASAQYVMDGFYEPDGDAVALFPAKKNVLLNASVKAGNHWREFKPELAVDGRRSKDDYWAGLKLPVALTADMGQVHEISDLRIFYIWRDGRAYQYFIEGSEDGEDWKEIVDARKNSQISTPAGFTHKIKPQAIRYIRTTTTATTGRDGATYIVELEAYAKSKTEKKATELELKGAVGSIDAQYRRDQAPTVNGEKSWSGVAWAGERLNGQLVLWTDETMPELSLSVTELKNSKGKKLDKDALKARFVRYTKGKGGLLPDVIETMATIPEADESTRPVWLTIDVPRSASPGTYKGKVTATPGSGSALSFDIELEVLPVKLTEPKDWPFHLDLWQNPFSVARYHKVELWSDEHYALMKPLYEMLADAGQKCVTVSLLNKPWGHQTHDAFDEMIVWIKDSDTWSYDYAEFDKYVEFVFSTGINQQINCYSMIPWGDNFRYFDKQKNEYVSFKAQPGTDIYENHWRPFLTAFVKHLKKKGWIEKTAIAMDERPHALMVKLMAFMKETAPELKIASAINYAKKEGSSDLYDISVLLGHAQSIDRAYLESRHKSGQKTTFYVCTVPASPNTFPHSPPAESAWQGLYASALNYSGFLRWAYCSWVADPLLDTAHPKRTWPAGDCFLVYPGPRTSVRFERLREGIQTYEKIRLLRMMAAESSNPKAEEALANLEEHLKTCAARIVAGIKAAEQVNKANALIEELSRSL